MAGAAATARCPRRRSAATGGGRPARQPRPARQRARRGALSAATHRRSDRRSLQATPGLETGGRMKVLHVYKDYSPVLGGIENHLRLLAECQVRAGWEVTVLVARPQGRTTIDVENGVRVIRAARWGTLASTPISPALVSWM